MEELEIAREQNAHLRQELDCARSERKALLSKLEDARQEADSNRDLETSLRNELFTLRGKVSAYQHCIAAITNTPIPTEVMRDNLGLRF